MENNAVIVLQSTFEMLLSDIMKWIPNLFGAILVIILGLLVAWALRIVIEKVVKTLKVDSLLEKLKITDTFMQFGVKLHVGKLLGWLAKWFIVILSGIAAAEILGWNQVTIFLNEVVAYLPNAFVAVILLLVGIVLGSFIYDIVLTAVRASKLGGAALLAGISKWTIFIFAFIAAMEQLGIAPDLLKTITTGLVAMLAIAGGLSFGLGGKEHAKKFLDKLQSDISTK